MFRDTWIDGKTMKKRLSKDRILVRVSTWHLVRKGHLGAF